MESAQLSSFTTKCEVMAKPAGILNDQEMMFVIFECSSHMDIAAT